MLIQKGDQTIFNYIYPVIGFVLIAYGIRLIIKRELKVGFSYIPLQTANAKGAVAVLLGIVWVVLGLIIVVSSLNLNRG